MLKAVVMSTALFWAGTAGTQTNAATNETWAAYGGVPGDGRYSALD